MAAQKREAARDETRQAHEAARARLRIERRDNTSGNTTEGPMARAAREGDE